MRSMDGGRTWNPVVMDGLRSITSLVFDALDPLHLSAGTESSGVVEIMQESSEL